MDPITVLIVVSASVVLVVLVVAAWLIYRMVTHRKDQLATRSTLPPNS